MSVPRAHIILGRIEPEQWTLAGLAAWAPKIKECVEGCANGSAGVEHVIAEHNVLAADIELAGFRLDNRFRTDGREVVPI